MKSSRESVVTVIPSLVTLVCMFLGFSAMIAAQRGDLIEGVWLIYAATFLDIADGLAAKALKTTSRFGGEVDSLSDMMTFGAAPALVMYHAYFDGWGWRGIALAFVPVVFSALRLARYNVQWTEVKHGYFQGIPTPSSAVILTGFVAFANRMWGEYRYPGLATAITFSTSGLMFSTILYPSNSISPVRDNLGKIALFALSIGTVALFGIHVMFLWGMFYVTLGPARWLSIHLLGWPDRQ